MNVLTHAAVLDDHCLFADSFALLLQREGIADIVQGFSQTDHFFQFLRSFGRSEIYIYLDYYFPKENGLALMIEIKRINDKAKVIFVTRAVAPAVIRTILQYRPNGLLSKSSDIQEVITCIDTIKKGKTYVSKSFAKLLSANKELGAFTPRELELLQYFARGISIADTASKLFLSRHTVVAHRRKMMQKTNSHSIAQLLTYARDNALI